MASQELETAAIEYSEIAEVFAAENEIPEQFYLANLSKSKIPGI